MDQLPTFRFQSYFRIHMLLLVLLVLPMVNCAKKRAIIKSTDKNYDFELASNEARVSFKWKVHANSSVHMELSVNHLGWIGIGFRDAKKKIDEMRLADFAVVWVDNSGKPHVCDYHTSTENSPVMDKKQNYELIHGEEKNGKTTVTFSRELVSEDELDDVSLSLPVHLLWGQHSTDINGPCQQSFGAHTAEKSVGVHADGITLGEALKSEKNAGVMSTIWKDFYFMAPIVIVTGLALMLGNWE